MRRPIATTALLLTLTTLAGCGDDATAPAPTSPATTTSVVEEPAGLGDAALVPVTGTEICRLVPPADATPAVGTEVATATPSDDATPQCTYSYGGDSSTLSSFTIASQRPEDVGDRGLQDAFDHVLALNRDAGGAVDETDVEVGDRAVIQTGEAATQTVIAVGDHLLTVLTTPDVEAEEVEALAAVVATALS